MKSITRNTMVWLATVFCILNPVFCSYSQCTFTNWSTGSDGDFIPLTSMPTNSGWSVSNNVVTITNKANGIFNFKKVYIATNWVVNFTKNTLNTPVYLLATTDVTVEGTIDVSATNGTVTTPGIGGPGGFDGGFPGIQIGTQTVGFGPGADPNFSGGGYALPGPGPAYGVIDILPNIGGSGGGGISGGGGGAGGGSILIASPSTVTIDGSLMANGGNSGHGSAGSGSGGAIRIIAQTIAGNGPITAQASAGGQGGTGIGRIRLEACTFTRTFLTSPAATFGSPGVVFLATNPTISVTSIAGTNTPAIPTGSLTSPPDVYLPTNFVNPATISVSASNITTGTTFKVIITPPYGTNLMTTGTLSGTYAFSTGSVSLAVYTDRVWRVNALIPYIPRP